MQRLAVLTMRITLSICGLWLLMNAPTVSAQQGDESTANCTLVLGFSQTADWYLAPLFRDAGDPNRQEAGAIFESIVDGDRWQLMWTNGAGVNVYSNPDSEAWSAPIILFRPARRAPPASAWNSRRRENQLTMTLAKIPNRI